MNTKVKCPRCKIVNGNTIDSPHMEEKKFYPHYHMRDEQGMILPWRDEFTNYDNSIPIPKLYICPKCGYSEIYHNVG